ncbi:MDR family MFS transporter [Pontibacillus marinus]|uniref:Major facilitator superfamily (MFS) profile domain-containing protein n=1 Tax=Pontibacillus marinus BH030004 = DSM 16465 TaxID=1385511 RepID=A0A0A5GD41_9BACI|nr:MFS transporter [Pontibacillus marinus]KGX89934.1 hypothetical protein N783_03120 [Pontibacillus marinus BH030004 = DSM 16465]
MKSYLMKFPQVVWIQAVGHALTSFVSIILLPFLTLYLYDQLSENIVLTTLIVGVQPFTEILFTILFGGWIDRLGRRPVMLGSLLFQVIAIGGFAFASHVWLFVLFTFINGVGRFVYIPAARAQIADTVSQNKQAETFALLSTASSIGALGGPAIGAFLFKVNQEILFITMATFILIYLLAGLKLLPESNPRASATSSYNLKSRDYKMLGWLMIGMLPISLFHAQMETNWPVFLKETVTNYLVVFSVLETIGTIVFILFEVILVNRTSQFSRFRVIQTGYILYALSSLGFGFFNHIVGFIVSQVLFCLGAILTLNHIQTFISTLAPEDHKGRYFALFGLHWDISRSVGPFLGGTVLAGIGGEGLYVTVFLLIVLGVGSQIRLIRSIESKEKIRLDVTS